MRADVRACVCLRVCLRESVGFVFVQVGQLSPYPTVDSTFYRPISSIQLLCDVNCIVLVIKAHCSLTLCLCVRQTRSGFLLIFRGSVFPINFIIISFKSHHLLPVYWTIIHCLRLFCRLGVRVDDFCVSGSDNYSYVVVMYLHTLFQSAVQYTKWILAVGVAYKGQQTTVYWNIHQKQFHIRHPPQQNCIPDIPMT